MLCLLSVYVYERWWCTVVRGGGEVVRSEEGVVELAGTGCW